jgi:hypothetical protein
MGEKSGSGMNNLDHIFESLKNKPKNTECAFLKPAIEHAGIFGIILSQL